jgi:predicted phosphodiesterase
MIRVLFTDTHFGVRQNSITWLESQMAFLDNELIPWLKAHRQEEIRLIHLGDVFESRSSISPMIAKRVREKFLQLRSLVKEFYIVAGNHDFYSPERDDIESLSLVFKDCDIRLVIDKCVIEGEDMFVPWYEFKKQKEVLKLISTHPEVKNIYTHADIFGEDKCKLGVKVFSGHIHIPQVDEKQGLYNLGSCYALNFADNNHYRHWYVYNGECLNTMINESSIMFWRLYNDEIFNVPGTSKDYYELYVDQLNMQNPEYANRISELTKTYKNIWVIPIIKLGLDEGEELASYDIDEICRSMIPKHLKKKFKMVEEAIK